MRDRRRRVLTDEGDAATTAATAVRLAGNGNATETYSDAGRRARQSPVSGLFPLRKMSISLVVGSAILAAAGCLGLHIAAEQLSPMVGSKSVAGLRLDSPASLARWLSATLLGLAAATAVFIYSLRKHRIDDYHGRYRMWLTMAASCMIASVVENTGLAVLVAELLRKACAAVTLRFDIVWPAAIVMIVALLALRLTFEIRRSWPALTALVLAALAFTGTIAVEHGWPVEPSTANTPLWLHGFRLGGYVLVLLTFLLYSRRIQMDVAGAAIVGAKPKRKKVVASDETAPVATKKPALKIRTDLDPVEPAANEPQRTKESKVAAATIPVSDKSSTRLSHADRKKMRQEQRKAS